MFKYSQPCTGFLMYRFPRVFFGMAFFSRAMLASGRVLGEFLLQISSLRRKHDFIDFTPMTDLTPAA